MNGKDCVVSDTPIVDAIVEEASAHGSTVAIAKLLVAARKLERDRARLIEFIQEHALGDAANALISSLEAK